MNLHLRQPLNDPPRFAGGPIKGRVGWTMRVSWVIAILAVLGLSTGAGAFTPPVAPASVPVELVVSGPNAPDALERFAARIVDDYGAFATAWVSPEAIPALAAQGFGLSILDHTTGRGAYRFDAAGAGDNVARDWRADTTAYALVAFRGPVKPDWRSALEEQGPVFDYLPFHSYLVRADPAAAAGLPGVLFAGAYHDGYKVEPALLAEPGPLRLSVLTFPDADVERVRADALRAGVHVDQAVAIAGLEGLLRIRAESTDLRALAAIEGVSWIERGPGDASFDNEIATSLVQSGNAAARAVNDQGLDGSSQVVSVCDTGVDTTGAGSSRSMLHEMFSDAASPTVTFQAVNPAHRKVLLYYAPVEGGVTKGDFDDANGHGTHTGGTIAGDAAPVGAAGNHDSGAFAAKMAVCDITVGGAFQIPADYSTMWLPAYDIGARINSNSWGSPHNNAYTDLARQHDNFVWTHRDFTVLRSAGNTGPNGQIRPEAIAKDALAVASSRNSRNGANPEDLSGFSSRGPAADGRLKPDITAPGECLQSADQGTVAAYVCLSGTSMSTPTTAAAAALVRDYFAKGFYPGGTAGSGPALGPTNALVRGMLFASGYEMTGSASHAGLYVPQLGGLAPNNPGATAIGQLTKLPVPAPGATFPNSNVGWGRVRLDDGLHFAGDARKLFVLDEGVGLATGETAYFTVTVADPGQALRILLSWSDFPGAAGANPALVNDLDLRVSAPVGIYGGNNFLGNQTLPALVPDQINNVEVVNIPNPSAGAYTISIIGSDVPQGPQPYAILAVGGLV